jgi:hypothetical protein
MSRSSAVPVALAVPFALYALWAVQAGVRAELAAPVAPAEKAAPDEKKHAEARVRAEKWARDVRQTSAAALQFRAPGPEDKIEDADCLALARAAAARAADLTDLEKFLSGAERPAYTGKLKERYAEWQAGRAKLATAEGAVETWLKAPLAATDGPAAASAMKAFEELVAAYRTASPFADGSRAALWQVEARVMVLEALDVAAQRPFDEVLALPLPLPDPKVNKTVERALAAPAAIREHARLLDAEVAKVAGTKRPLPERLAKTAAALARRGDEWAAREQLLALLADPELLTDPGKAADWLPKVQAQFNKTQSADARELIRQKVQQFCEAHVPRAARLDASVLVRDKETPRINVKVVYASDAKAQPLTDHPGRLNEFNFATLHRDFDQVTWPGGFGGRDALKPTPASLVARDFNAARAAVTVWTPAAVEELKKKCEGPDAGVQQRRREQLDTLPGAEPVRDPAAPEPASPWTRENSKIWTRLAALSAAVAKAPALFDAK